MAEICTPGETLRILDKYGFRARKKFGQNFLIDGNIVRGIIAAADITEEDCVLEIGPGIGSMTGLLSRSTGRVVAVEIDESLRPVLAETLADCPNVDVIWQDVLKLDLRGVADQYHGGKPLKAVANLPYYITTPILMKLLEYQGLFESITVMVQKEVADRLCAAPGTKDYGAITLAVQYYSEPRAVLEVPPSSFIPRPGVDSSVVCLKARPEPPVQEDPAWLFAVVRLLQSAAQDAGKRYSERTDGGRKADPGDPRRSERGSCRFRAAGFCAGRDTFACSVCCDRGKAESTENRVTKRLFGLF